MTAHDFWNERRKKILRNMVDEGRSASQIAEVLHCTPSAVIGKCHREGLQLKSQGGRPRFHSRRTAPEPIVAAPETVPEKIPVKPPAIEREFVSLTRRTVSVPLSRPGAVALFDLRDDQCRWPTVDGPPILFCGESSADGRSYCPYHARVSFGGRPGLTRPNFIPRRPR